MRTMPAVLVVEDEPAIAELIERGGGSSWLFPARKMQERMVPHIDLNTVGAAMAKNIRPVMLKQGVEEFTVHDLRRTARSHLSALGVLPHIAERCLNHSLGGLVGVYDQHDYMTERRAALKTWASFVLACEAAKPWHQNNVYRFGPLRDATRMTRSPRLVRG